MINSVKGIYETDNDSERVTSDASYSYLNKGRETSVAIVVR